MSSLRERWRREQYDPTWLGLLVNPFYFARRGLRAELEPLLAAAAGELLDVGCGRKPYRALAPGVVRYVGLDLDTPDSRALGAADAYYDGGDFPFGDGAFDVVLCSQVLEHVFTPEVFLREIRRVLRPGGTLILTVPFAWDEHEQPRDFARYSSFGLSALLERNGFAVLIQRKSLADARALAQLASGWIFKITHSRHRVLNRMAQLALVAPVNLLGAVAAALLPGHPDFYLDNVVLAQKRTA